MQLILSDTASLDDHVLHRSSVERSLKGRAKEYGRAFLTYSHLLRRRTDVRDQGKVRDEYGRIWGSSNEEWLKHNARRRLPLRHGNESLRVDGFYLRKIHAGLVAQAVSSLGCKTVLEVGSGRGNNLIGLAGSVPSTIFTGVEPVEEGTMRSHEWLKTPLIPQELALAKDNNPDWASRVSFVTGDGRSLPFPDKTFDAAFTILTLEQIPYDYPQVVKEMSRVARRFCMFVEPFAEANDTLGKLYLKRVNYFRFPHTSFVQYGLKPILFSSDYPHKIKFKTGFLTAEVS